MKNWNCLATPFLALFGTANPGIIPRTPAGTEPHGAPTATTLSCRAIAAVLLTLAMLVLPASASHLMLSLNQAQPLDEEGAVFLAAREAAHNAGDPDRFKIKGDLWIDNNGMNNLEMTDVTISYPGSGLPSVTQPPVKDPALPAGGTGRMVVFDGLNVELPVPLPPVISFSVAFDGTSETFEVNFPLDFYVNDTPAGSHIFPMATADLAPGQYWRYWNRHVDQGSTGRDRYAYDFDVVQWHGGGYIKVHLDDDLNPLDGSENSHYLAFGKPLYAVADGFVVRCVRGVADNIPGVIGNGGGNELWIQHGGEVIRYSHIRQGKLPFELCPFSDGKPHNVQALNIQVEAGQFIGEIGNTGQSSDPHLHISVHARPDPSQPLDTGFETADARPLNFHNIRIASHPNHINDLGANPTFRSMHGRIVPSQTLILPNPCGMDFPPPDFGEISYHGISAGCYQDVSNLIVARGYRPVFVDGYEVAGQNFFNAVYRPAGPANLARHGLTGSEYQDLFDVLTDDGYRLHQVDSYTIGSQVRYAAIFEQRPGPAFAAFHGLNTADYGDLVDDLAASGFVPVNVSTVELGGQLYWTGLFEQVAASDWALETVPVANYQAVFNGHVAAGRIPVYVHGFDTGVGPFITGIWIDPVGGATAAVHGLSTGDYQNAYDANLGAGRLTRAVSGYDDGTGMARWAAVWRGPPNTQITDTPPAVTNQPDAVFAFKSDNPFTTLDCRLDLGFFWLCDSPKSYFSLAEGHHTFRARAVDRELVRDPTPATYTWLVDLTPPEAAIALPEENTKTVHGELKDDPVEITTVVGWAEVMAEASDALSGIASVEFSVNGIPVPGSDVTHQSGTDFWSFQFAPDQNGEHIYLVSVTATDVAGNSTTELLEILGIKTGKKPPK